MLEFFLLKSTKSHFAQDGGFVTTMLAWLLENEIIRGAYVVDRDEDWNSSYSYMASSQELLRSAGSKYLKHKVPWKEIKDQKGLFGFVGTPCLMEIYQKKFDRGQIPDSVRFALICHGSFEHKLLGEISDRIEPKKLRDVIKMDFVRRKIEGKNRVVLEVKGNNFVADLPLKDLKKYKPKACQECKRVSTHLADFVCGSGKAFAADNYTVVACTIPRASDYCNRSIEDGWFDSKKISSEQIKKMIKIFKFI